MHTRPDPRVDNDNDLARPITMAEHTLTMFAHTNHEHTSTSSQIVSKQQPVFHPFCSLGGKPSPAAPMFSDNLRRVGA
jgi:hypothetical protein